MVLQLGAADDLAVQSMTVAGVEAVALALPLAIATPEQPICSATIEFGHRAQGFGHRRAQSIEEILCDRLRHTVPAYVPYRYYSYMFDTPALGCRNSYIIEASCPSVVDGHGPGHRPGVKR